MLSYSALRSRGRVGAPSIDAWNTDLNIVKEPPKLVMTRKRDKVLDSTHFLESIDESHDRLWNEAVRIYPTSINPAVDVMYGNTKGGTFASLPRKVMNNGAFRPPILTQAQLAPLSRQRIPVYSIDTGKQFIDYSKTRDEHAKTISKTAFRQTTLDVKAELNRVDPTRHVSFDSAIDGHAIQHISQFSTRTNLSDLTTHVTAVEPGYKFLAPKITSDVSTDKRHDVFVHPYKDSTQLLLLQKLGATATTSRYGPGTFVHPMSDSQPIQLSQKLYGNVETNLAKVGQGETNLSDDDITRRVLTQKTTGCGTTNSNRTGVNPHVTENNVVLSRDALKVNLQTIRPESRMELIRDDVSVKLRPKLSSFGSFSSFEKTIKRSID